MKKSKSATAAPTVKPSTDRKEVNKVIAELRNKYGENAILVGGIQPIKKIPTGIWPIDSLSGGGFARRRWSQIFGPKSVGKTTLCLHLAAQVQKAGGIVGYCDAEHSFDVDYAKELGVDTDNGFIYGRPQILEESETFVQKLAPHADLIIVDSIVAVSGEKERRSIEEKGLEKDSMMVIPGALSKFFRIVTPIVGKGNAAVVLVNQNRTNAGGYVAFDDFSGGNALRHANSLCLYMRSGPKADNPKTEDGKKDVGQNIVVKVDKNKTGGSPQGHTSTFHIWHDRPYIRPVYDLVVNAIAKGIITRSGASYSLEGQPVGVGRDKVIGKFAEDVKLQKELAAKMKNIVA